MAYSNVVDDDDIVAQIHAVRSESLGTLVLRQIRKMILNGELRPGDKANEVALSKTLGVSRGPVREACRQLVQAGLLDAQVQRGTFVKQVSFEEAEVLHEIRSALYGMAGRLLASRITNDEITKLDNIIQQMEKAYASRDVQAHYPLSHLMHESILTAAGNPKLRDAYFDCWHQIRLFRLGQLPRDDRFPELAMSFFSEALEGRKKIVEAIKSESPDVVSDAFKELVSASWGRTCRIHKIMQESTDGFESDLSHVRR